MTQHFIGLCEAASKPKMRFIPVKSIEQQNMLCVYRLREGLKKDRTLWRTSKIFTEDCLLTGCASRVMLTEKQSQTRRSVPARGMPPIDSVGI